MLLKFVTLLFFLLGCAYSAPAKVERAVSTPIPPSQDSFYSPPSGYASRPLGSILKSRTSPGSYGIEINGNDFAVNLKGAYQLMYRTEDVNGNPAVAVTTILVPYNVKNNKLVSYHIEEDSSFSDCAPSYTLLLNSRADGVIAQLDFLIIQAALNAGYIVNIPDYEGLNSGFTVGQLAYKNVLNSIRAALLSTPLTGLSSSADIVMWGYSGGSIATGWAAQMHPTYAPELNLKGAAMGGVCSNITAVMLQVNGGGYAGLVPAGVTGFQNTYPQVGQLLDEVLLPSIKSNFSDASKQCMNTNMNEYVNLDFFSWTTNGQQFLYDQRIAPLLVANTMGVGNNVPSIPVYMYHSESDEVAPVGEVDKLYNQYCSKGGRITYMKNPWANHVVNMLEGCGGAFAWLQDRLNGVSVAGGCSSTVLPLGGALLPENFAIFGVAIANDILDLIGKPIGNPF